MHYDGGATSAGIVFFAIPTVCMANPPVDEPDAVFESTWRQTTWRDHAAIAPQVAWGAYPPLPDRRFEFNVNIVESSIEDSISMFGMPSQSPFFAELDGVTGTFLIQACRFARNSAAGNSGGGGIRIMPPPAGDLRPTVVFEGSEWVANVAGSGPGVYVQFVRPRPSRHTSAS